MHEYGLCAARSRATMTTMMTMIAAKRGGRDAVDQCDKDFFESAARHKQHTTQDIAVQLQTDRFLTTGKIGAGQVAASSSDWSRTLPWFGQRATPIDHGCGGVSQTGRQPGGGGDEAMRPREAGGEHGLHWWEMRGREDLYSCKM